MLSKRLPIVLRHIIYSRPIYSARRDIGGFYKKSIDCNDGQPAKQTDHKAQCYCEADARSDWAPVLALIPALPDPRPTCELSSKCKQCANEEHSVCYTSGIKNL